MFKLYIDKKAINMLIDILKKNDLTQIEVRNGRKSIKIAKDSIKLQNISKETNEFKNSKTQDKNEIDFCSKISLDQIFLVFCEDYDGSPIHYKEKVTQNLPRNI